MIELETDEPQDRSQLSQDEEYCVLVQITGGCINCFFVENAQNPKFVVSLGSIKKTASVKTFAGIFSSPQNSIFKNLKESQIAESCLRIEDANGRFGVESNKSFFCSMLDDLKKQNKPTISQTWQQVPFVWSERTPKPPVELSSRDQGTHSKIPLLTKKYVELDHCGWLDLEVTIFHVKPDKIIYRLNTDDWNEISRAQLRTTQDLLSTLNKNTPLHRVASLRISEDDRITVTTPDVAEPYPHTEVVMEGKSLTYLLPNETCEICKKEICNYLSCEKCDCHFCFKCAKIEKFRNRTDKIPEEDHHHILSLPKCSVCKKIQHGSFYPDEGSKLYCWSCAHKDPQQKKSSNEFVIANENLLMIKRAHSENLIPPTPHLWLDKLEYIALAFQNLLLNGKHSVHSARQVFECMTAEVFVEAYKMWLNIAWKSLIEVSVMVLSIIKERIRKNELGNWREVQSQCESIVQQLLDHLPVIENKSQEYYGEIASLVHDNLGDILDLELKNFVAHDSFYHVISSGLWKRRSLNMWPLPFYVTPNEFWLLRTFLFILFICILTFHAYSIPQSDDLLLRNKISDVMGWSDFEGIKTFDDYWYWVENLLLPSLYDNPDLHTYFLVDKVIIRQFRVPEEPCSSGIYPNITSVVPFCYHRKSYATDWEEPYPTWKNVSISEIGKSGLIGYTSKGYYGSASFAVTLNNRDRTESEQTIQKLINEQWLDWGTQAIVIEFLIYSPNSDLVAAGVMLGEFSNVGQFVGSSDVMIVSEHYLEKQFGWSGVILLFFLLGFFFEEIIDFYFAPEQSSYEEREEYSSYGKLARLFMYFSSTWNIMDIVMVISGTAYLVMQYRAAQMLQSLTLQDVWTVAEQKQIEEVFGSITLLLAYFRVLDYLSIWENIGVLVIAIFKMMADIVKFLFIFVLVVVGFSTAFHLSYSGVGIDTWDDFLQGVLYTFLSAPNGYAIPEYYNLLKMAGPVFGLISQTIFVFVVVFLLLNLLIALMWETYSSVCDQATVEYRWLVSKPLKSGLNFLLPSPFTGFHVLLMAIIYVFNHLLCPSGYHSLKEYKESIRASLPTNYEMVMRGMVVPFLKNNLGDDFKQYLMYDNSVFVEEEKT